MKTFQKYMKKLKNPKNKQKLLFVAVALFLLILGLVYYFVIKSKDSGSSYGGGGNEEPQEGGPLGGPYECPKRYEDLKDMRLCNHRGCMWDHKKEKCVSRIIKGVSCDKGRRPQCNSNHSDCLWNKDTDICERREL